MSLEAVSEEALTTMLHLVVAVHHPLETAPRLALNARGVGHGYQAPRIWCPAQVTGPVMTSAQTRQTPLTITLHS